MNQKQFGWAYGGLLTALLVASLFICKGIKNDLRSSHDELLSSFREVHNSLDSVKTGIGSLEKSLDNFYTSISAALDSSYNYLSNHLDSLNNDLINKIDKIEFPHIENFEVQAENMELSKSELRSLQRYFKAYNEHVEQNIKKYPTNL